MPSQFIANQAAAPALLTDSGTDHVRLNLGCGPIQPEGWLNIDSSNRARLASQLPWLDWLLVKLRILPPTEFNRRTLTADIRRRLPFGDSSVSVIYSGEMLEHLTCAEGRSLLDECYRILIPGGVLRVRVPDNYLFWRNYVEAYERIYHGARSDWTDEHSRWVQMFFRDICVHRPGLHSMGHYHKWMYDEVSLILAFERAGFFEVERRALHDSRIPDVMLVETRYDLIVEGVKPKHV